MQKQSQLYGTWSSSITPSQVGARKRLNDVQWDTTSQTLLWVEGHGKRGVLMAQSGIDAPREINDLSVRGKVGYGGGEFTVHNGTVIFSIGDRLYRQSINGGEPEPITPAFGGFASPRISPDGRWLAFVHTYEQRDGIALVDTSGEIWPRKLAYGTDFAMQPAWHPDGKSLAYIAWNHPNMPWDGTELRLVTLGTDSAGVPFTENIVTLTGNDTTSIYQPEFSPDGRYLSYVSDQSGYGHIYLYDLEAKTHAVLTETEAGKNAEHIKPAWVQGGRVYGWSGNSKFICFLRNQRGFFSLWRYDVSARTETQMAGLADYAYLDQISVSPLNDQIAMIASAPQIPDRIISVLPSSNNRPWIHARSSSETTPPDQLAQAEAISWTGADGEDVHGLFYSPDNLRDESGGLPPLIVMIHGGPTSQSPAGYDVRTQFFATRGFAVLHVNHRGSTGYGRAYMNKLRGNWGVHDVEDAVSGVQYLVDNRRVDPAKRVIMGSSAGGYTVLQSLVNKPGFYTAAVCMYGVANQFLLAQDTHKFEERYLDSLLGPLPQAADTYRERSPYFNADNIVDPVILLQGEDDEVVPRNQSDSIVASLRRRGVPHEYHVYEGEGHGFRQPETIEHYLNAIVSFLQQHVIYT